MSNGNYIEWPVGRGDENPDIAELLANVKLPAGLASAETSATPRDELWVDRLRDNWPASSRPLTHPGDWRPSVREAQMAEIMKEPISGLTATANTEMRFKVEALAYSDWLRKHMIIDAAAASMVSNVLLHSERGGQRNLRLIAFTQEDRVDVARRFEQEYLGLEPVVNDGEMADSDLRIQEDGLYGPYDFTYNERHGGLLPAAALARVLRTTPDVLDERLSPGVRDMRAGRYRTPWNFIRTDDYLVPARPFDDDPEQVMVGPVRELTDFGSYLLEETLRAYEMGVAEGR
jgi:hypothetical protein